MAYFQTIGLVDSYICNDSCLCRAACWSFCGGLKIIRPPSSSFSFASSPFRFRIQGWDPRELSSTSKTARGQKSWPWPWLWPRCLGPRHRGQSEWLQISEVTHKKILTDSDTL